MKPRRREPEGALGARARIAERQDQVARLSEVVPAAPTLSPEHNLVRALRAEQVMLERRIAQSDARLAQIKREYEAAVHEEHNSVAQSRMRIEGVRSMLAIYEGGVHIVPQIPRDAEPDDVDDDDVVPDYYPVKATRGRIRPDDVFRLIVDHVTETMLLSVFTESIAWPALRDMYDGQPQNFAQLMYSNVMTLAAAERILIDRAPDGGKKNKIWIIPV